MSELRVKKIIDTYRFFFNSVFRKITFKTQSFQRFIPVRVFRKILSVRIESCDGFIFTIVLQALALPLVRLVHDLKFWVVQI